MGVEKIVDKVNEDNDSRLLVLDRDLIISKHDPVMSAAWIKIWKSNEFVNWDHARAWLDDVSDVDVMSITDGYRLRFHTVEERILFQLTYMS